MKPGRTKAMMSMALDLQPGETIEDAPSRRRGTKRVIFFVLVFIAAIVGVYLSPIRHWLADAGRVKQVVQSLGIWVYPIGVLGTAMLVGCGVPRLLLCAAAGLTLGFWRGWLVG